MCHTHFHFEQQQIFLKLKWFLNIFTDTVITVCVLCEGQSVYIKNIFK